jgi:hypothetical protein
MGRVSSRESYVVQRVQPVPEGEDNIAWRVNASASQPLRGHRPLARQEVAHTGSREIPQFAQPRPGRLGRARNPLE